jgi:hypothetical protein
VIRYMHILSYQYLLFQLIIRRIQAADKSIFSSLGD